MMTWVTSEMMNCSDAPFHAGQICSKLDEGNSEWNACTTTPCFLTFHMIVSFTSRKFPVELISIVAETTFNTNICILKHCF